MLMAAPPEHAQLRSVKVARPNITVEGSYLSKVEIWDFPTGTEITKPALAGSAKLSNARGKDEVWVFPIECNSPLVPSTEVFVKAYDSDGKVIGKKSLPYRGATEIANALCGAQ